MLLVRCGCGTERAVAAQALKAGKSKGCGCDHRELCKARARHGLTGTRTHVIWQHMIGRCTNPRGAEWRYYGGRGIKICDRWRTFENFLADMGEAPAGLSIDRINNDGDYEPGNCRWATAIQQCRNTRKNVHIEFYGRTQTLAAWAEEIGIRSNLICMRLRRGFSIAEALSKSHLARRSLPERNAAGQFNRSTAR